MCHMMSLPSLFLLQFHLWQLCKFEENHVSIICMIQSWWWCLCGLLLWSLCLVLKTFNLKWAEKIPLFPLCMSGIFVCTLTSSPCLCEHHYTHALMCTQTVQGRYTPDRYLTQYFWDSLTGNVKIPMIGLKMPCPSSQPMSLSLISNENIFSIVSYTMRRFSVS